MKTGKRPDRKLLPVSPCGFAATAVALCSIFSAHAAELSFAEFPARAVITSTNGMARTVPLVATVEPDGGRRVTVKAADARDAKWVDIHVDCATARTGDDGYWITQRGLLGYFTRECGASESGCNWLTLPYFGMKTPNVSFLAVMEGMRFEFDVRVIAEKGVYRAYPRWRVAETGIGAYEDMSVVVYPLANGAGYNEMAKAYRKYKEARDPGIKPIRERAKACPSRRRTLFSLEKFHEALASYGKISPHHDCADFIRLLAVPAWAGHETDFCVSEF